MTPLRQLDSPDSMLAAALAAARSGDRAEARRLLWALLKIEPRRSSTWLLLASVVESREDVQTCLHQVLYLEPGHELARNWIQRVEEWPDDSTAPPPPSLIERAAPSDAPSEAQAPDTAAEEEAETLQARPAQILPLPARRPPEARGDGTQPLSSGPAEAIASALRTTQSEGSGPRVLVVDDSATVRRIVAIILQRLGCQAFLAESGIEALSRISAEDFDLVLLDIGLPNLDGYQVLKILRQSARGKSLPVVLLTGRDGILDRVRGRLAGAIDYLTKPVDASTLRAALTRHLSLEQSRQG